MLPNPTNCFNFGQLVPRSHISLNGNKTWSAPVSSDKRSNAHPGAHSPCLLIALRPKICTVQEGRIYETLNPWHDAALSTPVCMCRTDCLRHKFSRQCPTKHTRSKRYAKKSNGFQRTDCSTESCRCESSNGGGYKPAIHDC